MNKKEIDIHASNIVDAIDSTHKLIASFKSMLKYPLDRLSYHCMQYVLNEMPNAPVRVIPNARMVGYDVDDDVRQILYLDEKYEETDDNIATYGIPIRRLASPKLRIDYEKLVTTRKDGACASVLDALVDNVNTLINTAIRATEGYDGSEAIITPVEGYCHICDNPNDVEFLFYCAAGIRDAATGGVVRTT